MVEKKWNWKKIVHGICIFIIAIWWLNSCQSSIRSQKSVTVYYGPSDYTEIDHLLNIGEYEEAVEFCKEELKEVPKDSDKEMALSTLLGEIYGFYIGDRDLAVSCLERAIEIARKNQNQSGIADACCYMAKVYVNLGGDMEEGLEYAEEAEKMYRNLVGENAIETANAMLNKGLLYFNNDQWENALENLEPAEKIFESRQEVTGYTCIRIGIASMKLHEYGKAELAFLKARRYRQEAEKDYYYASASQWLGQLYTELEEYRQAIASYEEALVFFEMDKQHLREKAKIYNNLAYCIIKESGEWENAILYGIRACQCIEEADDDSEKLEEEKEELKLKLKDRFYDEWKPEASDEEFEMWYQKVVLEGKDWREE